MEWLDDLKKIVAAHKSKKKNKNTRQYWSCDRKKRYANIKTANRHAREWKQEVYPCDYCKGYHLASIKENGR